MAEAGASLDDLQQLLSLNLQYQAKLHLMLEQIEETDQRNQNSRKIMRQHMSQTRSKAQGGRRRWEPVSLVHSRPVFPTNSSSSSSSSSSTSSSSSSSSTSSSSSSMAKGTPADFSLTLFPSAHANPDTLARRAAAEGLPLDFTAPQWTKPQTAKLRKVVLEQCRKHVLRAVHERSGSETNEWCAAQLENIKKLNDEELVALLQADSRPTNSSSSSSSSVRGGNGGGYVDDPTRPALVINWEEVAHHFGNRTASECRLQWAICQLPAASDAPWSKQENGRLVEVVRRHFGHDWVAIARELDTSRAPSACFIHYQRELNTSIVKKEWDASEDYLLRRAGAQFGDRKSTR